jgi:hypothetical protein
MADQQNLYTLAEAAELTGLSAEALRLRVKRGKLEGVRGNEGLRVRVTSADLEAIAHQRANQQDPTLVPVGQTLANDKANELQVLETAVGTLRERAERAEARAEAAQALADRRGEELAEARERAGRAEGEAVSLREQVTAVRTVLEEQVAAERARTEAVRAELAEWTAGGPVARAVRAFLNRRGRA